MLTTFIDKEDMLTAIKRNDPILPNATAKSILYEHPVCLHYSEAKFSDVFEVDIVHRLTNQPTDELAAVGKFSNSGFTKP